MARESLDREDLLRDATAFLSRVQLRVQCGAGPLVVFAGFRANGAASIYFDQDPVYHFNERDELRRAFVDDQLFKANSGRLVALRRQVGPDETMLLRRELAEREQQIFSESAAKKLRELQYAIVAGGATLEGQVTAIEGENVLTRVAEFLANLGDIKIAGSPHVGG